MLLGIHETILYGSDIPALLTLYRDVLMLRPIGEPDEHSAALRMPQGDAVLLLFHPDHASQPMRGVPTHGSRGPGHVAFRMAPGSLDSWRQVFAARGIDIELERGWHRGGYSLYVRDPAGNSVELVDGAIWPM